MKYLILLTLLLTGCTQDQPENVFKPIYKTDNFEAKQECRMITELGYIKDQSTLDQCINHLANPKYKIGQKFQFKDPAVMGKCTYVIKKLLWSHGYIMNKPAYEGDQTCIHKGELVLFIGDQYKQETELTERTSL
jgi:hypothetical protein